MFKYTVYSVHTASHYVHSDYQECIPKPIATHPQRTMHSAHNNFCPLHMIHITWSNTRVARRATSAHKGALLQLQLEPIGAHWSPLKHPGARVVAGIGRGSGSGSGSGSGVVGAELLGDTKALSQNRHRLGHRQRPPAAEAASTQRQSQHERASTHKRSGSCSSNCSSSS